MEQKNLNKRFGRLVVKEYVGKDEQGNVLCRVECDCGNFLIVKEEDLLNKTVRNCGCFNRKNKIPKDKYKEYRHERPFKVWSYMLDRCYNPNNHAYAYYGGRGISVCDAWRENYLKFKEFLYANNYDENAPFGECTVDRIDFNKGYSPENCRLVSMKFQSLNKSSNHRINYKGEIITVTEAAEKNSLTNHQVFNRLDKGWDLIKALETPIETTSVYTANDETYTIREWASILGVTDAVIRGRLKTHTMQEIYDDYVANSNKIEVNDFSVKYETADGKTMNRTEWCNLIGITDVTLRKLLKTYTMQEIYDDWKSHNNKLSIIRSSGLEYADGIGKTRKEWAKFFGISEKGMRGQLKKRTMQEIYDEFKKNGKLTLNGAPKFYEVNGETHSQAGWACMLGIHPSTLGQKLKSKSMQEIVDEVNLKKEEEQL